MLLKDCPVGSFVRLVRFCGEIPVMDNWNGEFEVFGGPGGKYVIDGDGAIRDTIHYDPNYQFEIVTSSPEQPKTIRLKGKTYNLVPVRTSDVIEIDGVEYYMEEK